MVRLLLLTIAILLGACTTVPKAIRRAPEPDIPLADVQKNFSAHQGKPVRWGGVLLEVENRETETLLQILGYPLRYNGRPDVTDAAQGRFIIKTHEFLDPAVYAKDRELTVTGRLIELNERQIGRKSLTLPVIESQQLYLWPEAYRGRYYGYRGYSPLYGNYRYGGYGYRGFYYRPRGYFRFGGRYYY
ncbi:MAG: Slp family lipoprotein [Methylobacter sp.]|uniref:Slp family lipoprotein n=1 Tax=Methylobacter sp. TaxID=2051955 RepID=UPI00258581E8|nr:Slp family lipoprotein [Methylobacter sp.]MCL7419672.1 Slp family lipoprotein [Methylobacter sp.]